MYLRSNQLLAVIFTLGIGLSPSDLIGQSASELDDVYYFLAARSATPDRQIAFLRGIGITAMSEASPTDTLVNSNIAAIQRAGGVVFYNQAMSECLPRLDQSETCPWFLGFDVYVTERPRLEGDTLRIAYQVLTVFEKDDCLPTLSVSESGEFLLTMEEWGPAFKERRIKTIGDTFNDDAFEEGACLARQLRPDGSHSDP